jgi:hypothetical protein
MDTLLAQLLEMHREVLKCEEWGLEWVRAVDAMAGVLDRLLVSSVTHAYLR